MKKNYLIVLLMLLSILPYHKAYAQQLTCLSNSIVRKNGDDGVYRYRIPGIVTSNSGTLVAVYDVRRSAAYRDNSDLPNPIAIGVSRSLDKGATWQAMQIAMEYEADERGMMGNGISDPAILVDKATGALWVIAKWNRGPSGGYGFKPGATGQILVAKSVDDGVTWSDPINVTEQIKSDHWTNILQGPGNGIMLRDGTLAFSINFNEAGVNYATMIYSKDHGKTWKCGKDKIRYATNEAQLVELNDGRIMLNSRTANSADDYRAIYTTSDLGDHWQVHPTSIDGSSATADKMIEPTCQASIIRYTSTRDGYKKNRLLFTNPKSVDSRDHFTMRMSSNEGDSWTSGRLLMSNLHGVAYSCITILDDQTIGVLFEDLFGTDHLRFIRFTMDELSSGVDPLQPKNPQPVYNGLNAPLSANAGAQLSLSLANFNITPIPGTSYPDDYTLTLMYGEDYLTNNLFTVDLLASASGNVDIYAYVSYTNGTPGDVSDDVDCDFFTFPVSVTATNTAPQWLKSIGTRGVRVGGSNIISLGEFAADANNDALTYSIQANSNSSVAQVSILNQDELQFTGIQEGETTIEVLVSDGDNSASHSFNVVVDSTIGLFCNFEVSEGFTTENKTKGKFTDDKGFTWRFSSHSRLQTNNGNQSLMIFRNGNHGWFELDASQLNGIDKIKFKVTPYGDTQFVPYGPLTLDRHYAVRTSVNGGKTWYTELNAYPVFSDANDQKFIEVDIQREGQVMIQIQMKDQSGYGMGTEDGKGLIIDELEIIPLKSPYQSGESALLSMLQEQSVMAGQPQEFVAAQLEVVCKGNLSAMKLDHLYLNLNQITDPSDVEFIEIYSTGNKSDYDELIKETGQLVYQGSLTSSIAMNNATLSGGSNIFWIFARTNAGTIAGDQMLLKADSVEFDTGTTLLVDNNQTLAISFWGDGDLLPAYTIDFEAESGYELKDRFTKEGGVDLDGNSYLFGNGFGNVDAYNSWGPCYDQVLLLWDADGDTNNSNDTDSYIEFHLNRNRIASVSDISFIAKNHGNGTHHVKLLVSNDQGKTWQDQGAVEIFNRWGTDVETFTFSNINLVGEIWFRLQLNGRTGGTGVEFDNLQISSQAFVAPPVVSNIGLKGNTQNTASFLFTTDKSGTVNYMVVPVDAQAPVASQIKNGVNYADETVIASGESSVPSGNNIITVSGLSQDVDYALYMMGSSAYAYSEISRLDFRLSYGQSNIRFEPEEGYTLSSRTSSLAVTDINGHTWETYNGYANIDGYNGWGPCDQQCLILFDEDGDSNAPNGDTYCILKMNTSSVNSISELSFIAKNHGNGSHVLQLSGTTNQGLSWQNIGQCTVYNRYGSNVETFSFTGIDLVGEVWLKFEILSSTGGYGIDMDNISVSGGLVSSVTPSQSSIKAAVSENIPYEEHTNSQLSVYPNPTFDQIYIDGLSATDQVYLFDALGHLISNKHSNMINLSSCSSGIYYLKIISDGQTTQFKIVKK